jgi:hypothetical protein
VAEDAQELVPGRQLPYGYEVGDNLAVVHFKSHDVQRYDGRTFRLIENDGEANRMNALRKETTFARLKLCGSVLFLRSSLSQSSVRRRIGLGVSAPWRCGGTSLHLLLSIYGRSNPEKRWRTTPFLPPVNRFDLSAGVLMRLSGNAHFTKLFIRRYGGDLSEAMASWRDTAMLAIVSKSAANHVFITPRLSPSSVVKHTV